MSGLAIVIKRSEYGFLDQNLYLSKQKGNIIHIALSLMDYVEELEHVDEFVKKALFLTKVNPEFWDINRDFVIPLKNLKSIRGIENIFPNRGVSVKIYKEREILVPKSRGINIFRPDRILIFKDRIHVVDFKTDVSSGFKDKYLYQIKSYKKAVKKVLGPGFKMLSFILYVDSCLLERV